MTIATLPSISSLSLDRVKKNFCHWRASKKTRTSRIPQNLWSEAVNLCQQYSIHRIAKELKLQHSVLQKRVSVFKTKTTSVSIPHQQFDFVLKKFPYIFDVSTI